MIDRLIEDYKKSTKEKIDNIDICITDYNLFKEFNKLSEREQLGNSFYYVYKTKGEYLFIDTDDISDYEDKLNDDDYIGEYRHKLEIERRGGKAILEIYFDEC